MATLIERLEKNAARLAASGRLADAAWVADLASKIKGQRELDARKWTFTVGDTEYALDYKPCVTH